MDAESKPLFQDYLLFLCGLLIFQSSTASADEVKAYRGELNLPTYSWSPPVRHPYFRGTDNVNIYPYPMLDNLSRELTNRPYQTVVLENRYLRITFLPELGGKVYAVMDKTTQQPMFYVNHVVKPGLIGQCGAWTSGGIEWNTGPQGHTVSAMQPVAVEILPGAPDGSRSVVVGETERIYGTQWSVVITLRPGRSFIEERIRIYNPAETVRPYYFWNCTAVPNTPGFRFIYPMTLGTDHSGEKFFHWPIDHGKDLSYGTNYQDASSIFAYGCDQDFFGSYDVEKNRGIVACANHYQVPGKKAWTWGQGSFGRLHQMDLTDHDGPYNEVQTGPLLTQGEVGRLEPCEAVTWQEWWYPIHGLGGFTFANRDVAVNAERRQSALFLRISATGTFDPVEIAASADNPHANFAKTNCNLSPARSCLVRIEIPESLRERSNFSISLRHHGTTLAGFDLPLHLPNQEVPAKKPAPQTASELVQHGWQEFLFARFSEAEAQFRKALGLDSKSAAARTGLAYLRLDSDAKSAVADATAALETDPDLGAAHYALAVALQNTGDRQTALSEAWKAALDPAVAAAARALAAKFLIRARQYGQAADCLAEEGPWQTDQLCRNRLALALYELGQTGRASRLAKANLAQDPLDGFARSILWLTGSEIKGQTLGDLLRDDPHVLPRLVGAFSELELDRPGIALRLLREFCLKPESPKDPITSYWAARLFSLAGDSEESRRFLRSARSSPSDGVFPNRIEDIPVLQWALESDPQEGKAALYLGHLLFHLGRHAEGRDLWKRAAALGAEPVIAGRALGLASLTLDHDPEAAAKFLEQANGLDRTDAIVARDLARVCFTLADKAEANERKRDLTLRARETLRGAFAAGQGRSDFVALLARSHNRLGEFAQTAQLLDSVRITVWEGAHEAHDLFEEAHLALGQAELEAGLPGAALAEFNRALEYPENLATGRLEETREAHIHLLRGNAFDALGQPEAAKSAWRKAAAELASNDPKKEAARKEARTKLGGD